MTFYFNKASKTRYDVKEIEVNSLEELLALMEREKEAIILAPPGFWYPGKENHPTILVYDDYIE